MWSNMSQQLERDQDVRVYEWHNTRDPSNPRVDIYGYFSPTLDRWTRPDYRINPISALYRISSADQLSALYEIRDARGFRELFADPRLPEIQRVDLSLSKAERVLFGNCARQRSAYAYVSYSPRDRTPETLATASARLASRKVKVRYGLRRERAPYRLEELAVDDGSVLYVTMRCSLCGATRRIKITARNQGRETPMCGKCHGQVMFVAKIRKVQNH